MGNVVFVIHHPARQVLAAGLRTFVVSGGGGGDGAPVGSSTPQALGIATPGVSTSASRQDHVHAMPGAADVGAAPASHAGAGGTAHADVVAAGAAGFMTGVDKAKLDAIALGATANADTDSLTEGTGNLYHTVARVRAVLLAGLSLAVGTAVAATDTVLEAFGKLQKQITDLTSTVSGKQATLVSATNIKTVNGNSLLGAGDLAIAGGASLPVVQTFTGAKTLALADINTYNVSQDATAQAVTLPAQATVAWTADAEIHIERGAAGVITIVGAAGVQINGTVAGTFTLGAQYSVVTLKRKGSNLWTLFGNAS